MKREQLAAVPWFRPETGPEEREAILKVLEGNYLNDGALTREFERAAAAALGADHAVAVTSGTAAISLALLACGVKAGDTVLVPDLTFIATANAVRLFGGNVKLVDVEPTRLVVTAEALEAAIDPTVKAVVTVDVNGRLPDYAAIHALCKRRGLALVCDAAEAFGSARGGKRAGTFGDASCFSFSAAKTISSGQGGLVTTNDPALKQRLIELKDQGRPQGGTGGNDDHPALGFNFKYTNLQAAVALCQLARVQKRLAGFVERDRLYREKLAGMPGVTLLEDRTAEGERLQWMDALFDDREKVVTALTAAAIECRPFWYPLHTQVPYRGQAGTFPNSIAASAKGLWLPSYFGITEAQIDRTVEVIRQAVAR